MKKLLHSSRLLHSACQSTDNPLSYNVLGYVILMEVLRAVSQAFLNYNRVNADYNGLMVHVGQRITKDRSWQRFCRNVVGIWIGKDSLGMPTVHRLAIMKKELMEKAIIQFKTLDQSRALGK